MKCVTSLVLAVLALLLVWSGAQAKTSVSPTAVTNKPCTPTPVVGSAVTLPVPCPPGTKPPVGQEPKAPVRPEPKTVFEIGSGKPSERQPERPRTKGDDVDDWIQEQIDKPIMTTRGFYETSVLVNPSLNHPGREGVKATWRNLLYLGILICLFAWVLHVGHTFHGTDQRHGRNPFHRLGIPGICLLLMLAVPTGYEALQRLQEWVWYSDSLNPRNADEVLSVVLPAEPAVDADGTVTYSRAGSIAPVRAKLGSVFGLGVGISVLITGLLGGLKNLLADFLIVTCPLYLGVSALAHDLSPAKRWLSVLVRTALLTSLFNAAWLTMQHLPEWMYWTQVDAVVFVALVLPAMLALAYFLWYRPLVAAVLMETSWVGDLLRHLKSLRRR